MYKENLDKWSVLITHLLYFTHIVFFFLNNMFKNSQLFFKVSVSTVVWSIIYYFTERVIVSMNNYHFANCDIQSVDLFFYFLLKHLKTRIVEYIDTV